MTDRRFPTGLPGEPLEGAYGGLGRPHQPIDGSIPLGTSVDNTYLCGSIQPGPSGNVTVTYDDTQTAIVIDVVDNDPAPSPSGGGPGIQPFNAVRLGYARNESQSDLVISPDSKYLYLGLQELASSGDAVNASTGFVAQVSIATGAVTLRSADVINRSYTHFMISSDGATLYALSVDFLGSATPPFNVYITSFSTTDLSQISETTLYSMNVNPIGDYTSGWAISDDGSKIAVIDNGQNHSPSTTGTAHVITTSGLTDSSFGISLTAHNGGAVCFPQGDNAHILISDGATGNIIHEYTTAGASVGTFNPGVSSAQITFMRADSNSGYIWCINVSGSPSVIIYSLGGGGSLVLNIPTGNSYGSYLVFDPANSAQQYADEGVSWAFMQAFPFVGRIGDNGSIWWTRLCYSGNVDNDFYYTGLAIDATNGTLYSARIDTSGTNLSATDSIASQNAAIEAVAPNFTAIPPPGNLAASATNSSGQLLISDAYGNWTSATPMSAGIVVAPANTTVAGSTSGNLYWEQQSNANYKKVVVVLDAYNNGASTTTINFTTAFTHTPGVTGNTTGLAVSGVSTTAMTIAVSAGVSGVIVVEGF